MLKAISHFWSRWTEFVWSSTMMKKTSPDYTACDSPECVRCHRYQQVREEAWGKLREYAETNGWQNLDQLVLAIGEGKRYQEAKDKFTKQQDNLAPDTLQEPNVLYIPTLEKKAWWDIEREEGRDLAYEALHIEGNFKVISREFEHLYGLIQQGDQLQDNEYAKHWKVNSTEEGSWCVFYLYNQGRKNEENCKLCPKTTEIIESLPAAMTESLFGNACFSVIYPQTLISEHYGPCNVRIRCHLGLNIPDNCSLTVAKEERPWQEGEAFFFDDSFLHSACNNNIDSIRAVFMVDLWHPGLSATERKALLNVF